MDPDDGHHRVASEILSQARDRRLAGVKVSSLALHELELNLKAGNILIGGGRATLEDIAEFFTDLGRLLSLYRLAIFPLTCEGIAKAANLRGEHDLTFYDSHHAASAMLYDSKIISTDRAYDPIPGLERIDPYAISLESTTLPLKG